MRLKTAHRDDRGAMACNSRERRQGKGKRDNNYRRHREAEGPFDRPERETFASTAPHSNRDAIFRRASPSPSSRTSCRHRVIHGVAR